MKFVIFSGTTEGRELSAALAELGAEVTVCVLTDYGVETQGEVPGVTTHAGAMSAEEKRALLEDAALCVDATHPYAMHVSASVKAACEAAGVSYLRLKRSESGTEGAHTVNSAAEAAAYLKTREGNILLTTGAKELAAFAPLGPERLFPRVLPSRAGIEACEALGVPHRNIIAMQGPFSREMNAATIRQYGIRWLVTKDGGAAGGYPEKAAAAKETGAGLLVLRRPEEDGLDFETVLKLCTTRLRAANKPEEQGETS
ncbi:MAG: precorrin-6A reductase [Oscillospiraceae bacterium]|nr:precorrin-6A reductase [Oscillospiraceae bacterium]